MAAEVFSGAVEDEIDPQIQRSLIQRSGEGIVGDRQSAVLFCQRRYGPKVGDLHDGIAGAFHHDQLRVWPHRRRER